MPCHPTWWDGIQCMLCDALQFCALLFCAMLPLVSQSLVQFWGPIPAFAADGLAAPHFAGPSRGLSPRPLGACRRHAGAALSLALSHRAAGAVRGLRWRGGIAHAHWSLMPSATQCQGFWALI
mmetsp:Transcript_30269/g.66462  ORF Transcript_30269/g.66462 Transcript_30269/m.66462 type:complete len:123 (-) Transcript_30269:95-463(-)